MQRGTVSEELQQVRLCDASLAVLVEIRAGLMLLEWAGNRKLLVNICIQTDRLMFVQGLAKPDKVCLSLQSVLFDFFLFVFFL